VACSSRLCISGVWAIRTHALADDACGYSATNEAPSLAAPSAALTSLTVTCDPSSIRNGSGQAQCTGNRPVRGWQRWRNRERD
jgi:hypothetical protein